MLIVAAGIAGIVALVHFAGGSKRVRLDSRKRVLDMWQAECPDHPATGALLEPSGFAALIELEDGSTGLLWAMGDRVAGRVLKDGVMQEDGTLLHIRIPDFTAPHIAVKINDPALRHIWVERLKTVLNERV